MSLSSDGIVTLSLSAPAHDMRLDGLLAELAKKRVSIINSTLKSDYFFVESYIRRGDVASVTCAREALPYLEHSLRAHRITYTLQSGGETNA